MKEDRFDVAYRLLDDELVDSDGRRCGRVDDIEFDGEPGRPAEITAILSGPGLWSQRMPRALRGLSARIFGDDCVSVPWDAVKDIAEVVYLKRPGAELGLGRGDDAVGRIVRRIPGS
jgi:sporulation protein YlmC with PRC-barrel domain